MTNEITIPALPCASIDDTLTFYSALGFDITYRQTRPNTYACVKRGSIDLHFFTMKGFDPANSYSTCIVLVADADQLYESFAAGLRQHYGKLPVAGIPRITRPNRHHADGDRRFNVIDPGGNWIRFVQQVDKIEESAPSDTAPTKLSRAIHAAHLLADHGDFSGAAKMLDTALGRDEPDVTVIQRVQALVLRAEVAANMNDRAFAQRLLSGIRQLLLTDAEQLALTDELQRMETLAQWLESPQSST